MSKICFISQTCGIGDIFFCQKIGYHFQQQGYRVIWPVVPPYVYIKDYMTCFEFPCIEEEFEHRDFYTECVNEGNSKYQIQQKMGIKKKDDLLFIPLQWCDRMLEKYELVTLNYKDWLNYFSFNRNKDKEKNLFNKLGLGDGEKYSLINSWFGSPPHSIKMKNMPPLKYKTVEMTRVEGFTLFDWMKVAEEASEICTTDSALTLLIEKENKILKAEKMTILLRGQAEAVSPLYKLNWTYIAGIRCW